MLYQVHALHHCTIIAPGQHDDTATYPFEFANSLDVDDAARFRASVGINNKHDCFPWPASAACQDPTSAASTAAAGTAAEAAYLRAHTRLATRALPLRTCIETVTIMQATLYQDYDALAYKPHNVGEERGAINHIKKAKQKTKGLEIVFDPKGHK
jgi:hypothetical protein